MNTLDSDTRYVFFIVFSIVFLVVFVLPPIKQEDIIFDEVAVVPSFTEEVLLEIDSVDLNTSKPKSYTFLHYDETSKTIIEVDSSPYADQYHIYQYSVWYGYYQNKPFPFKIPFKTKLLLIEVEWDRYDGPENITFPNGYVFDLESMLRIDIRYSNRRKLESYEIEGIREGYRVFEMKMSDYPVNNVDVGVGPYSLGFYTMSSEFRIKVTALISDD